VLEANDLNPADYDITKRKDAKPKKMVKFVLSDFTENELANMGGKILLIDDQISNKEVIDGFLMILGFKNRE